MIHKPSSWQIAVILLLGIVSISTAAVFIRLALEAVEESNLGFSLFLAASRLSLATIILFPFYLQKKSSTIVISKKAYILTIIAGFCLAINFASWISSLLFISVPASTTLVTTSPIWVALFAWLWLGEKPSFLTILGIVLALVGSGIITFSIPGDNELNYQQLIGNFLAILGAISVSIYLLAGKQAQNYGLSISNYIFLAYTTAALILLPLPYLFNSSYFNYPQIVYLYALLIAIFPQLIGHTSLNWASKYISPTLVSLVILLEPIGASILNFIIFKELPNNSIFVGGSLSLTGVIIALLGMNTSDK